MPAPAHLRLTFSGVFGSVASPTEEWSINFSAAKGGGADITLSQLAPLATSLRTAWQTHMPPRTATGTILTRVRVAGIGANGLVQRDASGAYLQGDDVVGGQGSGVSSMPLQIALAVTLHSEAGGPTGRGRVYLPAPVTGALGADGRLSTTVRDGYNTSLKAFLDACNVSLNGTSAGARIVVASGGSVTKGIPPALRPVTRISVGRVLDTQRRRRGKLPEERAFSTLA